MLLKWRVTLVDLMWLYYHIYSYESQMLFVVVVAFVAVNGDDDSGNANICTISRFVNKDLQTQYVVQRLIFLKCVAHIFNNTL